MKRFAFLTAVLTAALVVVVPFAGGGGPGLLSSPVAAVSGSAAPVLASSITVSATAEGAEPSRVAIASIIPGDVDAIAAQAPDAPSGEPASASAPAAPVAPEAPSESLAHDWEHLAQKPVPKPQPVIGSTTTDGRVVTGDDLRKWYADQGMTCPTVGGGSVGGAPAVTSPKGVGGTTSDDLAQFAYTYNSIRVANCLQPVPLSNFRYDSCMEQRLFWMAESPSEDPMDAWGHIGSTRIDGVPSVGCDGNLAGGYGNTGATVASKWWNSAGHRESLYKPSFSGSMANVCILFSMSHGGVPNEPYEFTRAAARWITC